MTATEKPPLLPPHLADIALKVWTAQHEDQSGGPERRRTGYYRSVWTVFIGPRAYALLRTVPDAQQVVVGRYWPTGPERGQGVLDRWTVMGVPVTEDPKGPLDLWRLADGDGTTIVWGELTQ